MKIKKLAKEDYEQYESFLQSLDEGLFFYSIKYKQLLEEHLQIESEYLLAINNNGNIEGILPLMKKEGKFGTIINSLPYYGSHGGVLAKTDKAEKILLDYYNILIKDMASSTYITNPLISDKTNITHDILDIRNGQWTPISYNQNFEENIMKSYHSKTRNLVRKAIKLNISVEVENKEIDFLYKTHYENMNLIGAKPKEKEFFKLISKYFKENVDYKLYVARLKGKKIAAVLLFYYNGIVEYFTPAILLEYRSYQPTSLIIYQAMIEASKNKYRWWNWGGTGLKQDGVYHFKKRFGAIDKEYMYFIKINNSEIYTAKKEELLQEYNNFFVIPFNHLKDEV